jgi:hypothetical protein
MACDEDALTGVTLRLRRTPRAERAAYRGVQPRDAIEEEQVDVHAALVEYLREVELGALADRVARGRLVVEASKRGTRAALAVGGGDWLAVDDEAARRAIAAALGALFGDVVALDVVEA